MTMGETIAKLCREEHARFREGRSKEYDADVYLRVGDYWDRLAQEHGNESWKGYNGRSAVKCKYDADGRGITVNMVNKNQPWSAAFVSWIMFQAGAGKAFPYSASHARYILRALKAGLAEDDDAPLVGRRRSLYAPKVGDLIACERNQKQDFDYDSYPDAVKAGDYEAHCDFVVAIDTDKHELSTIGGNVSNSVTLKRWKIDGKGRIGERDPTNDDASVICVIENRIGA